MLSYCEVEASLLVGWLKFNVTFQHKYDGYIRDEGKLVSTICVMLPQQCNPRTDCKSTQYCTIKGIPCHSPKLHPGPCDRQTHRHTDTHTDTQDHNTFCVIYDSREM